MTTRICLSSILFAALCAACLAQPPRTPTVAEARKDHDVLVDIARAKADRIKNQSKIVAYVQPGKEWIDPATKTYRNGRWTGDGKAW